MEAMALNQSRVRVTLNQIRPALQVEHNTESIFSLDSFKIVA